MIIQFYQPTIKNIPIKIRTKPFNWCLFISSSKKINPMITEKNARREIKIPSELEKAFSERIGAKIILVVKTIIKENITNGSVKNLKKYLMCTRSTNSLSNLLLPTL
jgi:hypothetical protein